MIRISWLKTHLWTILTIGMLILGIGIRAKEYWANRSFDHDESGVAAYVLQGSFEGNITQPPGFLWLEKTLVNQFGHGERVFRFPPLMFGLLALPLFWILCRKVLSPAQTFVAVSMLAFLDHLVDYTTQLKQYSGEMFASLIVLVCFVYIGSRLKISRWYLILLVAGVLLPWFGYAVIFVLASVGMVWFVELFGRSRRKTFPYFRFSKAWWPVVILGAVWVLNLLVMYFAWARTLSSSQLLSDFWQYAYLNPLQVTYFHDRILRIFADPLGVDTALGGFLFAIGFLSWYTKDKWFASLLVLPIGLTIIASLLKVYPYHGRLLYFLVPLLILSITWGMFTIVQAVPKMKILAWLVILFVFLFTPFATSYHQIRMVREKEESRPVIDYLRTHSKEGDTVYVDAHAYHAFVYYTYNNSYWLNTIIVGAKINKDPVRYQATLQQTRQHKRVWFFLAHSVDPEREHLFAYVKSNGGHIVESYTKRKAEVYLVEWQ